ncbi:uncharacterized protein LOC143929576 [Lithobates pipiens]
MRTGLKILHIIFFLLLLGSGDFQVRGLTVTGKDGPTEALRGENVTIPCLLSGVLIPLNLQIVSVVWSRRLQNGTEYKVHQVHEFLHESWRNGSHMNDSDLQQGNASLYIPNIQIEDEGEYLCFVIVTPDAGTATSTLHVSVTPQTRLNYDKHIEAGIPGSVFCEINNFYPEAVKVQWVKYSITTATESSLDRDVSLTIPLRNSDGTYNVTSLLTVRQSTGIEPGDVFFCTVSHRSLKKEMTMNFIMPGWSPLKDIVFTLFAFCVITFLTYFLKKYFNKGRRPWIHNVLRFIFIASCIMIAFLIVSLISSLVATDDMRVKIYIALSGIIISYLIGMHFDVTFWRFFKFGVPSLSEISGDQYIPQMKRTTLTCQITNFRQQEIQINVYLKRCHEIKRQLIASWDSTDQTPSNKSIKDSSTAGDQRDNKVHSLPLLEKGDGSRTLPVQMDVKMTKSWTGMYNCLCSITITPSADTDEGAALSVEVEHASLQSPISVYRTLTMYKDDFQVRGLTVTGKDDPIDALRGEDVTIPCLLSGVPVRLNLQILSVVWFLRLQNGTEYEVYGFRGSHQSSRPGSHMNDKDLLQGNASLSIPNIQITDEGDYRCFVITTPDSGSATSILHVSVIPQTTLTHDKHIAAGIKGSVLCEISNCYPEAVKVQWVKYSTTMATSSVLDRDVSLTSPLRNSDGTFNVTSVLTVRPSTGIEPGDVLSCIVSHRSQKEEITIPFIMPTWVPWINKFRSGIMILSFILFCLLMYFLVDIRGVGTWFNIVLPAGIIYFLTLLFIYGMSLWGYLNTDEPSLSEISGDERIFHMRRATLKFKITNFKQNEIQINVYLKRRNDEVELIASWESQGQRNDNHGAVPEEIADHRLLSVDMTKSWTGIYRCLCSIVLTPNKATDDMALLVVEVEYATLKQPIYVFKRLNVYDGIPIVSGINGDMWISHMRKITLTCEITEFRPGEIILKLYLKRHKDRKKSLIRRWASVGRPPGEDDAAAGPQNRDPIEENPLLEGNVNDALLVDMNPEITEVENGSYKCNCNISLTPNADTDDGAVLTVEVDHAALEWPIYKYHILNVIKGDNPSLWRRWRSWKMQVMDKMLNMYIASNYICYSFIMEKPAPEI